MALRARDIAIQRVNARRLTDPTDHLMTETLLDTLQRQEEQKLIAVALAMFEFNISIGAHPSGHLAEGEDWSEHIQRRWRAMTRRGREKYLLGAGDVLDALEGINVRVADALAPPVPE